MIVNGTLKYTRTQNQSAWWRPSVIWWLCSNKKIHRNCVHMGANLWWKNGDTSTDCDAYARRKILNLRKTNNACCLLGFFFCCCCTTLDPNMHRLFFNCFNDSVVGYCWSAALNCRHRLKRRNFSSSLSKFMTRTNNCCSVAFCLFLFLSVCAAELPFSPDRSYRRHVIVVFNALIIPF